MEQFRDELCGHLEALPFPSERLKVPVTVIRDEPGPRLRLARIGVPRDRPVLRARRGAVLRPRRRPLDLRVIK